MSGALRKSSERSASEKQNAKKQNRATAFKTGTINRHCEQERLPVKWSDREAAPKESNLFSSKIASTRTAQHSFAMTTSFKCGCPGSKKANYKKMLKFDGYGTDNDRIKEQEQTRDAA
ncbi:hypothetical protein [Parapedobacter sp.]